jgi:hypothetical protein
MRAIVTTSRTCVVAVTASATSVGLVEPSSFGAEAILLKPVAADDLLAAVGNCFDDTASRASLDVPISERPSPASEPTA